ncbi:MAG: helix-turn-helix transcriptional regulator [Butyricicoccaceae bacterium]
MDRITQVLKLIHSRWNEDISVPELAEQVHVSPNYLSRFFSRHIHMTITDYIGSIRIHHALTMLREDHCSVTDVALQAGFPNSSAFYPQVQAAVWRYAEAVCKGSGRAA